MAFAELKKQIEGLLLLGYNKQQIIEMVKIVPAIFKYTTEGIEYIFESIGIDNELVPAVEKCK